MDSDENKRLITATLSGEANLVDVLSDDATWVVPGFKSFRGKQEILERFFGPIEALMESMGRIVPTNVIAEGDQVVVEAHAVDRVTKKGDDYNNNYCLIFKLRDGKIDRLTEYSDTALAKAALPELDWNIGGG